MPEIANPHDRFFREVFLRLELARELAIFLRSAFQSEVTDRAGSLCLYTLGAHIVPIAYG